MTTPRGYSRALVDRIAGWSLGLPPELGYYNVTPMRITIMDDAGVSLLLAADLYRPAAGTEPVGQLLVFSPYGRGPTISVLNASLFAARGFQVLVVSCRGTYDSEGQLQPNRTEVADTQGVVRWMRRQDWYPGAFATLGASYLGYAQWALLEDPPDDLVGCVISVGPHDYSQYVWGAGAFRLDRIFWSDGVVAQKRGDMSAFERVRRLVTTKKRLQMVFDGVPLLESIEKHFGEDAPWLRDFLLHPDPADDYWAPTRHPEALEKANIPILLTGGWYDPFLPQTMSQHARLQERGLDVELTVGPWTHLTASGLKNMDEIYEWVDEHVAKRTKRNKKKPVRVHVGGIGQWRSLAKWPPPTEAVTFYLQPGDGLAKVAPPEDCAASTFIYNPADPTPTVGGPLLTGEGRVEDSALAARADVLAYTTEPLEADVEVLGKPSVELWHSSDNSFADIFVRLSEVDGKGRSYNITQGFKRLDATKTSSLVGLEMLDCAHSFRRGTRIRLLVAGGSFPMYLRNFGTGESPGTATMMKIATHRIAHGSGGVSSMALPVSRQEETGI